MDMGRRRGRKEKDLMVGQIGFLYGCDCVVRMDGFVQSWMVGFGRRHPLLFESLKRNIATVSACPALGLGT